MPRAVNYVSSLAMFLAGAATVALLRSGGPDRKRLRGSAAANHPGMDDMPPASEVVEAVEQLLSDTLASLDERLTRQARSIDILRSTVTQTDGLLERVLESLDSLQSSSDPPAFGRDPFPGTPAV